MDGINVTYGGVIKDKHQFICKDNTKVVNIADSNLFGKSILYLYGDFVLNRYGYANYIVNSRR